MRLPVIAALLVAAGSALALDPANATAVRGVIERQIEAFRRDDAAGAYAFAAPSIQRLFPSEELFLGMVRNGYKPVYRPRSYTFGDLEEAPDGLKQSVRVQDADGADWIPVYTLERQPDGAWKITGCVLLKEPGQAV